MEEFNIYTPPTGQEQPQSTQKYPDVKQPGPVDYMGMKLIGFTDPDIVQKMQDTGDHPVLLGPEKARTAYAKMYTSEDGKFDQPRFDQDYKMSSEAYKNFSNGLFDTNARSLGMVSSPIWGGYVNQKFAPTTANLQEAKDDRFISDAYGGFYRTKTDQQSALAKGKVLDPDFGEVPITKEEMEDPSRLVEQVNNSGKVLNTEYDQNGSPIFVIRDKNDPKVEWANILTTQGPQAMNEGFWTRSYRSFMNTALISLPSMLGSFMEVSEDAAMSSDPKELQKKFILGDEVYNTITDDGFLKKWGKDLQKYTHMHTYRTPYEEEVAGHNSWGSLVGVGLGFIAQLYATGGGVGKLTGSAVAGEGASKIVFGLGMADSYHQAAKQAGVTGNSDLLGYMTMFAGGIGLMGLGAKWFSPEAGAFGNAWQSGHMTKIAYESIQKNASDLFGKTASELTKEEAKVVEKGVFKDLMGFITKLPKKTVELVGTGMKSSIPLVSHPLSAGVEMSMIHILSNTTQTLSDYMAGKEASPGSGLFKDNKDMGIGDFFSRSVEGVSHSFKEGMIMGLAGAFMHTKKITHDMQTKTKQWMIINEKDGDLLKHIEKMYKSGVLDKPFINAKTGELIREGEIDSNTGLRPKSLNDLAWENFQNDLNTEKQAYIQSGLKNWRDRYAKNPKFKGQADKFDKVTADLLNSIVDPNKIASEGLDALYKKREAVRALEDKTLPEIERQKLEQQIKLSDEKIAKINSGEYPNELLRHGLIKADQISEAGHFGLYTKEGKVEPLVDITELESSGSMITGRQVDNLNKSISTATELGIKHSGEYTQKRGLLNDKTVADVVSSIGNVSGVSSEINARVEEIFAEATQYGLDVQNKEKLSTSHKAYVDKNVNDLVTKLGIKVDEQSDIAPIDQIDNHINSLPESVEKNGLKSQYNDIAKAVSLQEGISNIGIEGSLKQMGDNLLKEQAYLSQNTGTPEAPVFKSFESTMADFENSNLNTNADFLRVTELVKAIVRNKKILDLNANTLGKLEDSISLLNDSNRVTQKDTVEPFGPFEKDHVPSIAQKLNDLLAKSKNIMGKSLMMGEKQREYNELNYKSNDLHVRSVFNNWIVRFIDSATDSEGIVKDIIEADGLRKQYAELSSKRNKDIKEGISTDEQLEQIKDLQNKVILKNLVVEGKLHNWMNANEKIAEELFAKLITPGIKGKDGVYQNSGPFAYFQDRLGKVPGLPGDTSAFVFNLHADETGKISYNDYSYLHPESGNSAMAYNLFVNHFNTIKRISSSDFYAGLDKVMTEQKKRLGDKYKAPSYEQREVLRHVAGFLKDSSNLYKHPREYSGDVDSFFYNFNYNELYVQGFAGTGKTSEVIGNALASLEQIRLAKDEKAEPSKILLLAPSIPQVRGLKDGVSAFEGISKKRAQGTVDDYIKGATLSKESPDVIVIDEASELSRHELIAIRSKAKGSKILWLGDSSQIPSDLKQSLPDVAFGTEKSTPLTEVFRSGVYDITRLQQQYRDVSHSMLSRPVILLPTQYTVDANGHGQTGVLLRSNDPIAKAEQIEAFVKDLNNPSIGLRTTYIVTSEGERQELINHISTKFGIVQSALEPRIRTILKGEHTFKGLQGERIYASLNKVLLENNYNKGQLTAASRATNFLDIITDKDKKDLPKSSQVEALVDSTAEFKLQDETRIAKYADNQLVQVSEFSKTLSSEVSAPIKTQADDTFIFDKEDQEAQQKKDKKEKKVDEPVKKRSKRTYTETPSVKVGPLEINAGSNVIDRSGRVVRVNKIEIADGGEVLFTVQGRKNRMPLGRFQSNYQPLDLGKIENVFTSEETSTQVKDRVFKNSVERAKKGQHTFMSSVSMYKEGSVQDNVHREVKRLILQKVYNGEPAGLVKKYYKELEFFNASTGKNEVFKHAVTLELDLTNPKTVEFLKKAGVSADELKKMSVIAVLPEGPGKSMSWVELSKLSSNNNDAVMSALNYKVGDKLTADAYEYERSKLAPRLDALRNMKAGDNEYTLGPALAKGASSGAVTYDRGNYRPVADLMKQEGIKFNEPVYIFDPLQEHLNPASSSVIKYDGKFEPGYYLMYSHDTGMRNPGMIKLRSEPITNRKIISDVIKNYLKSPVKNEKTAGYFSTEGGFYDPINKFLSANRYFFGNNSSGKWVVRPEFKGVVEVFERKGKDGTIYNNFKVVVEGDKAANLKKLASLIEKSVIKNKDGNEIQLYDMATISPFTNLVEAEIQVSKLYTDVERINQPTVYVDIERVDSSKGLTEKEIGKKNSLDHENYDSEDIAFSIHEDSPLPKDPNAVEKIPVDEAMDKSGVDDIFTEEVVGGKKKSEQSQDEKARDYYSLTGIFHNANEVGTIRKQIARRIINGSAAGRDITSMKSFSEAKDESFELYKAKRQELLDSGRTYPVTRDGVEVNVPISDLTASDIVNLKADAKRNYVQFQLGRRDVFDKFIKNIFPNVIIGGKGEVKESIFQVDDEGHLSFRVGDQEKWHGESSIQTGNDSKNPLRNSSDAVKLFMNSIFYNEYVFDANGKRTVKKLKEGQKESQISMPPMTVHKILVDAANASRFARTADQVHMTAMERMADNLLKNAEGGIVIADGIKTTTKVGNYIFSLHDALFHDPKTSEITGELLDVFKKDGNYSYAAIARNSEFIADKEGLPFNEVKEKSKHAANVLSAIHNFYYSITSSSFDKIAMDKEGDLRVIVNQAKEWSDIQGVIRNSLWNGMFDVNGSAFKLRDSKKRALFETFPVEYKVPGTDQYLAPDNLTQKEINNIIEEWRKVDPSKKQEDFITIKKANADDGYRHSATGIFKIENGKKIKLISKDGNKFTAEAGFTMNEARAMFKFFGLSSNHVSSSTLNAFFAEGATPAQIRERNIAYKDITGNDLSEGGVTKDKLMGIFDKWMRSVTSPQAEDMDSPSIALSMNRKEFTENMSELTESELQGSPTAHHYYTKDLAIVEAYNRGNDYLRIAYTSDGRKIWLDTNSSPLRDMLGFNNKTNYASQGVADHFTDVHSQGLVSHSPFVAEDGKILNPLLDNKGDRRIIKMRMIGGVEKGVVGKGYSTLTGKEWYETSSQAGFIDSLISHKKRSGAYSLKDYSLRYKMPMMNMGTFGNMVMLEYEAKTGTQPVIFNADVTNATVNWGHFTNSLGRIFEIQKNKQRISHAKLTSFIEKMVESKVLPLDAGAYKNYLESKGEYLAHPEQLEAFIDSHISTHKNFKLFRDELQKSHDLHGNRDYKIVGDKIELGNDATMSFTDKNGTDYSDLFNADNYEELQKLKSTPEHIPAFYRRLIGPRLSAWTYDMFQEGISAEKRTLDFFKEGLYRDADAPQGSDHFNVDGYYRKKAGKVRQYNPFYEGFYLSYLEHSHNLGDITLGSLGQFKSLTDQSKYGYNLNTPRSSFDLTNPYGLKEKSLYVIVRDDKTSYELTKRLFGKGETDATDGWGIQVSAHSYLEHASSGAEYGNVKVPIGPKKQIFTHTNTADGSRELIKNSWQDTAALRNMSNDYAELEKNMLSFKKFDDKGVQKTLYDKLVEFNFDDKKLAEFIAENNLHQHYIAKIVPESAFKSGSFGVHDMSRLGEEGYVSPMEVENQYNGTVLDPNKDAREDTAAMLNQLMAQMQIGEHNQVRTKAMMNSLKRVMDMNVVDLRKQISENGGFKNFIKSIGIKATQNMPSIGNFVEYLHDPEATIHPQPIDDRLRTIFLSKINDGIRPRMSGGSYVQNPGHRIDVWRATKDVPEWGIKKGSTFVGRAFLDKVNKYTGFPKEAFIKDAEGLAHARLYDASGNDMLQSVAPDEIVNPTSRKALLSKTHKIGHPEAVIGFKDFDKFGFNDTPGDVLNYKNYSLDQIMSMNFADKSVRYDHLGDTPEERKAAAVVLLKDAGLESDTIGFMALHNREAEALSKSGKKVDKEVIEKASESAANYDKIFTWYENLIKHNQILASRIPSSKTTSGNIYDVVEYNNDASNTIFTSPKKNILDDSDYDVDELRVYMHAKDGEGNVLVGDHEEGHKNTILDNAIDYYKDKNNLELYLSPVSTSGIEGRLDAIDLESKERKAPELANDVRSNKEMFVRNMMGSETMGIFVNSIKSYSQLFSAYAKDKKNNFNIELNLSGTKHKYTKFTTAPLEKIDFLASILQSALDNPKKVLLGRMFGNTTTADAIAAMGMVGVPVNDIIKFISSDTSREVLGDVLYSKNLGIKTRNFSDVINSWDSAYHAISNKMGEILANNKLTQAEKADALNKIRTDFKQVSKVDISGHIKTEEIMGLEPMEGEFGEKVMVEQKLASYDFTPMIDFVDQKLTDIDNLRKVMLMGEGVRRTGRLLSFTQGISSGQWDLYRLNRDVDNIMTGEKEYMEPRPTTPVIRGQKFSLGDAMQISEVESFEKDEAFIRDFIDYNKVVNTSPNIQGYLNSLKFYNDQVRENVIVEHPVLNSIVSEKLEKVRIKDIGFENQFNAVKAAKWKILTSLYLEDAYGPNSGKNFSLRKDTNGDILGEVYLSRKEDQVRFLAQLPDTIERLKLNPEEFNPSNPDAIRNNYFLNKLDVKIGGNGDKYLTLSDTLYFTDREKSALKQFAGQLSKDSGINGLEEMLYAHNLVKNALRSFRGDFTEYLPKDTMVDFGKWLDEKHDALSSDPQDQIHIDLTKRLTQASDPFFVNSKDVIPTMPNKLSDFHSDYLKEEKTEGSFDSRRGESAFTERFRVNDKSGKSLADYPDYVRGFSVRRGAKRPAEHIFKLDREKGVYNIVENKYSDLINNWGGGAETMERTFHSLPLNKVEELSSKASKAVTAAIGKNNYYPKGLYYLKDGTPAMVTMIDSGKVEVSKIQEDIARSIPDDITDSLIEKKDNENFAFYQNAPSKRSVLERIVKNSQRLEFRYMAQALLESKSGGFTDKGSFLWMNKNNDPNLAKQTNTAAYFGKTSKNIVINTDLTKDASFFERHFLHEMNHNHLLHVIEKGAEQRTFAENRFVEDLQKVYDHVSDNMSATDRSRHGMLDLGEFTAEAFSNLNFQRILHGIDAHPDVKTLSVPSAWQQFVGAVKRMFDLQGFKRISPSTLDQVFSLSTDIMERDSKVENYAFSEEVAFNVHSDMEKKFSFASTGIRDIHDINELITGINSKEQTFDDVNQLIGKMDDAMRRNYGQSGNKYTYFANGKEYTVSNINDTQELRDTAKTIITDQNNYQEQLRENVMKYALTGDKAQLDKTTIDNHEMIRDITRIPMNGKIMTYSDLAIEHPELHNKLFSDYEPLVIVSKQGDKTHISLVDVTSKFLNKKLGRDRLGYIADEVVKENPNVVDDQKLRLWKDELGQKKLNMILTAMDMKSKDPNVVFDNMIVAKVSGDSAIQGVYLPDYIKEVQQILHSPKIYDLLPEELKLLVDNKTLALPETFDSNYFGSLLNGYRQRMDLYEKMLENDIENKAEITSKYLTSNSLFNKLNQYNQGHEIFKEDVKNIIQDRMRSILNSHHGDELLVKTNEEYTQLSHALFFLDSKGTGMNMNKWGQDVKSFANYYKGNYNLANPIAQWYRFRAMKSLDTVMNKFVDGFKKDFNESLDRLNEEYQKSAGFDIVSERLKDIGAKRFEPLFVRDKVQDRNGNTHDVNSYEIHFRYKDSNGKMVMGPKTAEALRNRQVTEAQIDFGGFVVKKIRDAFIQNRMLTGSNYDDAKHFYDTRWKDGMLPIMKSRASEKIFTKDWKTGLRQWLSRYSNSSELFDYMAQNKDNAPHKISDMFAYQMDSGPYGSKERETMIGLEYDNAQGNNQRYVSGKSSEEITASLSQNESGVEKNMEVLMNYLMMNHHSKMELEKVMPVYYGALSMLNAFEGRNGEGLSNTMNFLRTFTSFILKGERKGGEDMVSIPNNFGHEGKNITFKLSDMVNNLTGLTAFSVMDGNIFADIKNFGVNGLNNASFASANTIAGGKFAGSGDYKSAINVWHTNPKLASAITDMYRMASFDRGSAINSQRFSHTTKRLSRFHLTYGQFAGDYLHRGAYLMAQMIKDGSFDAHYLDEKGNLVYDARRDKRFFSNGKATEEGKMYMQDLIENLKEEGVQGEEKLPVRGYDSRQRQSVKAIVDKYIMGAYDEQGKRNMEQLVAGRFFALMKRYLFDKAEVLYSTPYENNTIGKKAIKEVEVNGVKQKQVVWEGTDMEGVIQSIFGMIKDARTLKGASMKEVWQQSSDVRRINIVQTAQNLAIYAVYASLAPAMFGMDDKELNSRHSNFMRTKIYKTMMYTFGDLLSTTNPREYFRALNEPFFALSQLGRLSDFAEAVLTLNTQKMQTTASKAFGVAKTVEAVGSLFQESDNKTTTEKKK